MSNESKALELAQVMEDSWPVSRNIHDKAIVELRRQHAEIESLRAQLAEAATELRAEQERRRAEIRAQLAARVPEGWSYAGHFYNLVTHALMDVGAPHGGAKFRLKEILKELEQIHAAPSQQAPQPGQPTHQKCDDLRRALEIIAVGDAPNPQLQAAEELIALGYWCDIPEARIPASQQAPVQGEPVAKIVSWANGSYCRNYNVEWMRNDLNTGCLLYTTPQRACKPMAIHEINELAKNLDWYMDDTNIATVVIELARAVESFHKIGENQ